MANDDGQSDDLKPGLGQDDPLGVGAALDRHRAEPNVTPDRHIQRLMIELGESIAGKRKIYLDTRYWIYMRDAAAGRPQTPVHASLLKELRLLVSAGMAVCPISDVLLLEFLKQSDETTRLATARIVDELSGGVALIHEDLRVGTEFAHFFFETGARASVHPIEHLVWTKSCYVWGETYPTKTPLDAATERAMQKAFIDHLWGMSLESMLQELGRPLPDGIVDFEGTAQRLNEANRAHVHELRTFQKLALDELAGVLDLYEDRLADLLAEMYQRQEGRPLEMSEVERRECGARMRTALINLFRLKPEVMRKKAPTLYVSAKCHAAVRWDKKRNLAANDLMDFHHAAAGLGYCDAFFTDKPLKVLLCQHHVGLPGELERFVTADAEEAVGFVRTLAERDV